MFLNEHYRKRCKTRRAMLLWERLSMPDVTQWQSNEECHIIDV
jgi:hypothetical protein